LEPVFPANGNPRKKGFLNPVYLHEFGRGDQFNLAGISPTSLGRPPHVIADLGYCLPNIIQGNNLRRG
jgi:hypothetical protein